MTWGMIGAAGITAGAGLATSFLGGGDSEGDVGSADPRNLAMAALMGGFLGFDEDTNLFEYRGGDFHRASPFGGAQFNEMFADMTSPTAASTAANNIVAGTRSATPNALEQSFYDTIDELDRLIGPGGDKLLELIETGLPTSIESITNSRLYDFNEKFLPSLREQMPGGTLDSSYMPSLSAREAGRISAELGGLEFDASEAAKQRQLEAVLKGVPAYSTLTTARGLLPQAVAADYYNLSNLERGARPGALRWNMFNSVMGFPGTNGNLITSAAQPSGSSQILSSMADVIPAVANIYDTWSNNRNGGGNNMVTPGITGRNNSASNTLIDYDNTNARLHA